MRCLSPANYISSFSLLTIYLTKYNTLRASTTLKQWTKRSVLDENTIPDDGVLDKRCSTVIGGQEVNNRINMSCKVSHY